MSAISRQQKTKGEGFLIEAEKTLAKKTWFASSTEQKHEEAAELYEKAANAFKVGGCHAQAGDAYSKAADIHRDQLKQLGEASKCLSSAGAMYKNVDPAIAIEKYQSAISLLCDAGRLTQAAKLSKEVAEIFENDEEANISLAIENYEQAAELFGTEQSRSQQSQCMAKVAELCSAALDPPDLLRAAQIYDKLGRECLESNLLKFNAKGYFLQSAMCHLANGDSIGATQAVQKYENLDYTFSDAREGKFARQLIECVENYDPEGFATACFEYDRITKLDPWKTSMLVKVKRTIEGGDEAGLGGDDEVDLT